MAVTLPNTIIKYFIDAEDSANNGFYFFSKDTNGDFVRQEMLPEGGGNLVGGDNTFDLDANIPAGREVTGLGGADTYIIRSTIRHSFTITDPQIGRNANRNVLNKIVFDDDVTVTGVTPTVRNDMNVRLMVTLGSGAVITIEGPANFEFVVKGAEPISADDFTDAGGFSPNNAPIFDSTRLPTNLSINEGQATAENIGTVTATDSDSDALSYSVTAAEDNNGNTLDASHWTINNNGEISYDGVVFDRDTNGDIAAVESITLTIQASDAGGATGTAQVTIMVTDILDTPTPDAVEVSIDESTVAGEVFFTLNEFVPDVAGSTITYELMSVNAGDASFFDFDTTARTLVIKQSTTIDHAAKSSYSVTIRVTEAVGSGTSRVSHFVDQVVTITVMDQADMPPVFTNASATAATVREGMGNIVFDGTAIADLNTSQVTYRITDGDQYVEVDANGQVTLKDAADADTLLQGFSFTIEANDNAGVDTSIATHSVAVTLTDANDIAPSIVDSSITIDSGITAAVTVTADDLSATDGDLTATLADDIVYTVVALATGLDLTKDGPNGTMVLAVDGTFTQQDIINEIISLRIADIGVEDFTNTNSVSGLRLSLSDGTNVGTAFDFSITVRQPESVDNVDEANTVELSNQAGSYTIKTGDGNDVITAAGGDDVIEAGFGDDIINLDGDDDSSTDDGRDKIVYSFGSGTVYSAVDGGDTISGFKRGEDVFLLQTVTESAQLQTLDDFLASLAGAEEGFYDDHMAAVPNWVEDMSSGSPVYYVAGIALHFQDAGLYSGGRLSSGVVKINFDAQITWANFLELIEVTNQDRSTDINFDYGRGTIKDLTVLPTLLGEGSLRFEAITPATLSFGSISPFDEGEDVAPTSVASIILTNGDGYRLRSNDARFEIVGDQLMTVAGADFDHENGDGTISVDVTASRPGAPDVTATVSVMVADVNEAPTSTGGTIDEADYTFAAADFQFDDPDDGDTLQGIEITTLPTSGMLQLAGDIVAMGQVIDITDILELAYTADSSDTTAHSASFTYKVSDGALFSEIATLTINIPASEGSVSNDIL
jgi:hypothetical protein